MVGFPALAGIFLLFTASKSPLGPSQPPIKRVPGVVSPGVKRPGREADYSPPSTAEVNNTWIYTSNPPYIFVMWSLIKHMIYLHGVVLS
jgi:hypothetical protein